MLTLRSYESILKVFIYGGHECGIWNKSQKSTYDIFDELKPDIYISDSLSETEQKCVNQYNTKFIKTTPILAADVFLYRPIAQTKENVKFFACDNMSIINHDRNELSKLKDVLNIKSFKLFSPFTFMMTEYCQDIPQEIHSAALCCAKRVYATNFLNFFNFMLANPNTIYPFYSMKEVYPRERVLEEHTCFSGAKTLIEENGLQDKFDNYTEWYGKFRNENSL